MSQTLCIDSTLFNENILIILNERMKADNTLFLVGTRHSDNTISRTSNGCHMYVSCARLYSSQKFIICCHFCLLSGTAREVRFQTIRYRRLWENQNEKYTDNGICYQIFIHLNSNRLLFATHKEMSSNYQSIQQLVAFVLKIRIPCIYYTKH